MRSAVYYRNNDVRIEERPVPEIGHGEMLLKVMAVGICGSDVHEFYRINQAPLILGHELAGFVEKVGDSVTDFRPGDRIFVFHHVPCGACPRCVKGHETACDTFKKVHFFPGGFSEYVRIHPLQVRLGAIHMPDDLPFDEASFTEPVGCVVRGQRLAGMAPGRKVLILGSGIAGIIHIQVAKAWGASLIVSTDVSDYRKDLARKFGAHEVLDGRDDVVKKFRDLNDGWGADIVILSAMAPTAVEQAIDAVDKGGNILVFGLGGPDQTMNIPLGRFLAGEISVIHSYSGAPADARMAFSLIRNHQIDVKSMITHRLPLEQAQEGFRLTAEADRSLKVMLYPHGVPDASS
jgi:L-iditol 2-dehydrogenase